MITFLQCHIIELSDCHLTEFLAGGGGGVAN